MEVDPKISIIVPNFNKGIHVRDCLNSVVSQKFTDWELIFIDDRSTDDSLEIARSVASVDNRIKIFENESEFKGANYCRNLGINKASADLILFFDSDDLMVEDCLSERWNDKGDSRADAILVHQTGLFYDRLHDSNLVCNIDNGQSFLNRFLARDLVWLISGPLWPRTVLDELNGFDLKLQSHQEYDLHVRALIMGYKFEFHNKSPKVFYRQNVLSESRKNSQTVEHLKARAKMTWSHFELLKKYNRLDDERKKLISRYFLDIAQMMRWHKLEMGREALNYAISLWDKVHENSLIDKKIHSIGKRYIKFKHQMIYNRVPRLQMRLNAKFKTLLDGYIYIPSNTFCKTVID